MVFDHDLQTRMAPGPLWRMAVTLLVVLTSGWILESQAGAGSGDPLEQVNRPAHSFNDLLDRHVAKPVVDAYVKVTSADVRESVSNFYDNLTYPNVILNDFLQGKFTQGLLDTSRFLLNTSLGVGGLFDPAAKWGMEKHEEDFGQTLGVWGLDHGAYLVLPTMGPSSTRDAPGLLVSTVTNVLFYVTTPFTMPIAVLGFIDRRARADEAIRARDETAVEPYVFTREAFLQHRKFMIHDGDPPLPDILLDDTFVDLDEADEKKNLSGDPS